MQTDKTQANRVRRLARKHGYGLRKSREWRNVPHGNNFGDYMLIDVEHNVVVRGARYDATLDEIETFLSK